MACLVIASGEQKGTQFGLLQRPLAGGRDPAREIQIKDPGVSRRHFVVDYVDGRHVIREAKSKNGVIVNRVAIAGPHPLRDGDEIRVGETTLIYFETDVSMRKNAVLQQRDGSRELREEPTMPRKPSK